MSSVGAAAWAHGQERSALAAAGGTDSGTQRDVNEDRFHCHAGRGLFIVIDGVGGQAAGGRAADIALALLRERLERETGPVAERIREGITIANNEIHRQASTRAEWRGMACVLTAAVVSHDSVTFGHVGDTRLYKIRGDRIEKLTRDHSPVGEREDARELSELQAMKHPRRNEVYRDVGSDPHEVADREFVEVGEVPFEADAALLLCSDGLTDLVDSASVARTVRQHAGDPDAVVRALIDRANDAGGKDNVTVVYVERERFAADQAWRTAWSGSPPSLAADSAGAGTVTGGAAMRRLPYFVLLPIAALLAGVAAIAVIRPYDIDLGALLAWPAVPSVAPSPARLTVPSGGSIAAALREAPAGSEIVVEPGEYREQLMLKAGVRLVSRIPRGAIIRLPAAVREADAIPAVIARDVSGAALAGFVISGDAATPLAIGIFVERSDVSLVDLEVTGASTAAVEFARGRGSTLIGSEIRDNPGSALVVRGGAAPRIAHNTFVRNGTSDRAAAALRVESGAAPVFSSNVFVTATPESYTTLDGAAYVALRRENWFISIPPPSSPASGRSSSSR